MNALTGLNGLVKPLALLCELHAYVLNCLKDSRIKIAMKEFETVGGTPELLGQLIGGSY